MTAEKPVLDILVVDDDHQVLQQMRELLPTEIDGYPVCWDYQGDFGEALELLRRRRYDVLVSDVYRSREGSQKNVAAGDIKAKSLVDEIRMRRFCPIIIYTDGQLPEDLVTRPFVWSADKAAGDFERQLLGRILEAIGTGLPHIARRLHDELDKYAGSYVWQFLATRWEDLNRQPSFNPTALERVIRRRAAIQLGRLDGTGIEPTEYETAEPVDFYVYPSIGPAMRLGEVLRRKGTNEFRIVLAPHCFLVVQPGKEEPRATHVLTVQTVLATDLRAAWEWPSKAEKRAEDLRRRTAFPASKVAPPEGRYCFLPAFLDIPDLYCDLLQLESVPYATLVTDFERIAVLDTPYAEALQANLSRFYGAVGVPVLNVDRVQHLTPGAGGQPGAAAQEEKQAAG